MLTYWVLGKGDNIISPSLMMPAGVPQAQSPSLQRQSSHHSSLAAVVLGMMQASKRNNVVTTRKWNIEDGTVHVNLLLLRFLWFLTTKCFYTKLIYISVQVQVVGVGPKS